MCGYRGNGAGRRRSALCLDAMSVSLRIMCFQSVDIFAVDAVLQFILLILSLFGGPQLVPIDMFVDVGNGELILNQQFVFHFLLQNVSPLFLSTLDAVGHFDGGHIQRERVCVCLWR